MRRKLIQISGLAVNVLYTAVIVWLFATEPRSFKEVATGAQVATGTYQVKVEQPRVRPAILRFSIKPN